MREGQRPSLLDRLRWWRLFRDVTASDVTLCGSGGKVFLEIHTGARFKGCITAEVTPTELRGLADQIHDILNDEPSPGIDRPT